MDIKNICHSIAFDFRLFKSPQKSFFTLFEIIYLHNIWKPHICIIIHNVVLDFSVPASLDVLTQIEVHYSHFFLLAAFAMFSCFDSWLRWLLAASFIALVFNKMKFLYTLHSSTPTTFWTAAFIYKTVIEEQRRIILNFVTFADIIYLNQIRGL